MKSDMKVERKVNEVERVSTCRMPQRPSGFMSVAS